MPKPASPMRFAAPEPRRKPAARGAARGIHKLTDAQAKFLRRAWDYLAATQPGRDPDSRLLAMVCLLRAARTGTANLVSQDVRTLRAGDPLAAVSSLTSTGWLSARPESVLAADPESPAACGIPDFADPVNPWGIGKLARTRASGWTLRLLSNKLLRRTSNDVRITALYLTAHAAPDGMVEFVPDYLVAACALEGTNEMADAVRTLLEIGWLAEFHRNGVATSRCRLAEEVLALAPAPAPPPPSSATKASSWRTAEADEAAVELQAQQMVAGREVELVRWVTRFWADHGHGPSWSVACGAQGWPRDSGWRRAVSDAALLRLYTTGWLDGLHTPFGMRPGPRYRPFQSEQDVRA
ncbi:hypothetical protein [Allokutzneria oryzae]|uniref:DUF2398 family protein n=1 Tax=Allokutzneria oryzae TaxID=1378989 RepID=A0ABV6A3B3_9PSEU